MTKNKVLSCSTPERHFNSIDSDSDSASPVQFLCTQDGVEGEIEVVWNFYTPKSGSKIRSVPKNSTPVSSRTKKNFKLKELEKAHSKRKFIRDPKKRNELLQELYELNKNLKDFISNKSDGCEKVNCESDDDIFDRSFDHSPKRSLKSSSKSLRKNILSTKFSRTDNESALESDDSINEYLIKASQQVEKNIPGQVSKNGFGQKIKKINSCQDVYSMEQDSLDEVLKDFKLENSFFEAQSKDKLKKNLTDKSVFAQLTKDPLKCDNVKHANVKPNDIDGICKDTSFVFDSPSSKPKLFRHNTMPESPSVSRQQTNSGMTFGRHSTMPNTGDSPSKCTQEEIKKKHQQAKDRLLAKRLLPFTSQKNFSTHKHSQIKRESKLPPSDIKKCELKISEDNKMYKNDMKSIIEKKRQEALLKLRNRRQCSKKL